MPGEEIAAAAGVSALGAVAQYYQSQKAAKANQDRLDQIKQVFDSIKPPQYDVSVNDPPKYITQVVPEPALDFSKITPEQYKSVGQYVPEVAPYIAEQNPTLIKDTAAATQGKQARLDVLQNFMKTAQTGHDLQMESDLNNAAQRSQTEAQSREKSILQDAARRGQTNSGLTFAAQLQGGESAISRGAQQSQQAALSAYQAKLQAMKDSASLGGQIANDETNETARNAGIINDFNQRTSKNANAYQQYRSGLENSAQTQNLNANQSLANQNVSQNNQAAEYNQNNQNKLAQYLYGIRNQSNATQNQLMTQNWQNQNTQQDRTNKLASQQFADTMAKYNGEAGIANQYNALDYQKAQDTNSAIQGLTSGVNAGAMNYGNSQARQTAATSKANQNFYNTNNRYMDDDELDEYRTSEGRF